MSKIKSILFILSFYPIFLLVKLLTILFTLIQIKQWLPKREKTVLYFENFPIDNAGYQYRAKKWSDILNQNGFKSKVLTTVKDKAQFEKLINQQFSWFLIRSSIIRLFQILFSIRVQTIVVRRELLQYNDYGNLFMEKLLFSLHKKQNIILDFDDNIAAAKNEGRNKSIFGKILLENNYKFTSSLKLYDKFIVCSEWHVNYVKSINSNADIEIIPTCINFEKKLLKQYVSFKSPITIGWIGGNGNQKYLDAIIDDLNEVHKKNQIELLVISGVAYENSNSKFVIKNIKWSIKNQENDMLNIDIGIMPLPQKPLTEGKCGFKLLQYMSLGIVSIASPVGINKSIINHGVNGYLVNNNWTESLLIAIQDKYKWETIGMNAMLTTQKAFSYRSNKKKYLEYLS